jgi:hypothetical protein
MGRLGTEDGTTVAAEGRIRQGTAVKRQGTMGTQKGPMGTWLRETDCSDIRHVSSPGELHPLSLLLLLWMAHFLCDFGLQNDRMAREKCPGCDHTLPWGWWLTAHGAIHGLAVGLLTGLPLLGVAETAIHALIDHSKCRGRISFTADQTLHLFCKGLWVALLALS